jgi:hypothetical protein
MKTTSIFTLIALAGIVHSTIGAELAGKVTLKGTPPPELPIDLAKLETSGMCSAERAKMSATPITTRHYVVSPEGGLANVFVWVKQGVTGKFDPPAKEAVLDQHGCEYVPYVQGIQTGQKLKILNSDPFLHNVNCQSTNNKAFNTAQVVKGQTTEKIFDKQEVLIKFKCDVHPWMFAYIGVVDHPFFCVTDKDGKFTIPKLPAGKYTLEAFHLKSGVQTQEITVGDDDKKDIAFTFEPAARK